MSERCAAALPDRTSASRCTGACSGSRPESCTFTSVLLQAATVNGFFVASRVTPFGGVKVTAPV